ncbi:MAG: hypothetical protein P1U36_04880 [Legionellaceae bacterium]|nr:hypothetical protein [Legionellaceae bacterium]
MSDTSGIAISGSYAYIIGLNTMNVITCEVNANNGNLSNCFDSGTVLSFSSKTGLAVLNNYLYVSSEQSRVEKCLIGNDGSVSGCASTGSGFVAPAGNMTFITR